MFNLYTNCVLSKVPGSTHYSMVFYFVTKRITPRSLLERFVDGDDEFRNSRLKLIPSVPKVSFFSYLPLFIVVLISWNCSWSVINHLRSLSSTFMCAVEIWGTQKVVIQGSGHGMIGMLIVKNFIVNLGVFPCCLIYTTNDRLVGSEVGLLKIISAW